MAEDQLDWRSYLADHHRNHAGVTEAVLGRSSRANSSPYRWLARAVSDRACLVVDLACGSGPMSRELTRPGRTVIGLDLSEYELSRAAERGPGPWLRADALKLPFGDATVDAITSSMGLVVVTPLNEVVAEAARVLRPGGVLAAIAPALRPLRPSDIAVLTRINTRLRAKPQFPGPVELAGFTKTLAEHGLRRVEDQRERYSFPVRSRGDAELILSALYLPNTPPSRVERAVDYLADRLKRREEVEVAIPIRRVVAIK